MRFGEWSAVFRCLAVFKLTPASLGYPLSVFNKKFTLKETKASAGAAVEYLRELLNRKCRTFVGALD